MRIIILSDTHDDLPRLLRAMTIIDELKPEAILHCGDICSPHMLKPLARRNAYFVFGNNDYEETKLREEAARLGITCLGHCDQVFLAGKSIAMMHGHDPNERSRMLGENVNYLFSGHTHERHDLRNGATRLINPGALYRAKQKTVALLDLETDGLTLHEVA